MPVRRLYETEDDYVHAGEHIFSDLKVTGQSKIHTRLVRKNGTPIDCEIQMATLNTKNPLFSRMVTITDVTKRLAINRELEHLSRMPHLELNPVIEVNEEGQIVYFNEVAIDILIREGNGTGLEAFLPPDIGEILSQIPKADGCCVYRTIRIGTLSLMLHIILSSTYRIARISAFDTNDAKRIDDLICGNTIP
jgi:PAS domain-containing protein